MNTYNKLPSSIDEQLDILRARGMDIDDEKSARIFLKENYFYRFLNYSVPYFTSLASNNDKSYIEGTKFSDVANVYHFDSKLRILILEYIEQIEISIKTQFIHLAWKYGPHFYLNRKLFKDKKLFNDSLERLEYQTRVSSDLLVSEYLIKYSSPDIPPVWAAVELMSIGQFTKWYLNLKSEEDKESISKHFKLHHSILQAVLENFTLIRNYSAHYARIWNRHYDFKFCVRDDKNRIVHDLMCSENNGIYVILLLMTYLLKPLGKSSEFVSKLTDLINEYMVDTKLMNFTDDWRAVFEEIQHG